MNNNIARKTLTRLVDNTEENSSEDAIHVPIHPSSIWCDDSTALLTTWVIALQAAKRGSM